MIDRDEEQIARILCRFLGRLRQKKGRTGCPDDESLGNYLGGLLTEDAKIGVETHLAECSFCLNDLVAVHKAAQDYETERVLQRIIDRAMALVPPIPGQESFLDLVVKLVKGSLELVRTSGQWVDPFATAPVGIRGRPKPSESSILQVEKEMGRYKVAVEVELVETGLCQVAVRVTGEAGKPAEGIRLSLISGGREQASYLTRLGEAVFDRIPQGEYNLAISHAGIPAGVVQAGDGRSTLQEVLEADILLHIVDLYLVLSFL